MVITAGRIKQSALELGSSTAVLTDEDLKKSGKKTLAEALSVVPGISITQNGGTGKSAHVYIRGMIPISLKNPSIFYWPCPPI